MDLEYWEIFAFFLEIFAKYWDILRSHNGAGERIYELRHRLHHLCLVPHLLRGWYSCLYFQCHILLFPIFPMSVTFSIWLICLFSRFVLFQRKPNPLFSYCLERDGKAPTCTSFSDLLHRHHHRQHCCHCRQHHHHICHQHQHLQHCSHHCHEHEHNHHLYIYQNYNFFSYDGRECLWVFSKWILMATNGDNYYSIFDDDDSLFMWKV